ncbi:MAG TPA: hypothetical protein VK599_04155 [Streptosporangiaceae bacterium]|nr:hypothetical protein [Streptosporangiaceae bacterium]
MSRESYGGGRVARPQTAAGGGLVTLVTWKKRRAAAGMARITSWALGAGSSALAAIRASAPDLADVQPTGPHHLDDLAEPGR